MDWHNSKLGNGRAKIDECIDQLFALAVKFELDSTIEEHSDLESIALHSSAVKLFEDQGMSNLFAVLNLLPYDASKSVRALLDYLCNHPKLRSRWKAVVLKTGLYLLNPYARICFYIFLSSVLFTWETVTKLRKPIMTDRNNIFYLDTPSYKSSPAGNLADQLPALFFRDDPWIVLDDDKSEDIHTCLDWGGEDPEDFWYGVLSCPHRRYFTTEA